MLEHLMDVMAMGAMEGIMADFMDITIIQCLILPMVVMCQVHLRPEFLKPLYWKL